MVLLEPVKLTASMIIWAQTKPEMLPPNGPNKTASPPISTIKARKQPTAGANNMRKNFGQFIWFGSITGRGGDCSVSIWFDGKSCPQNGHQPVPYFSGNSLWQCGQFIQDPLKLIRARGQATMIARHHDPVRRPQQRGRHYTKQHEAHSNSAQTGGEPERGDDRADG